MNCPLRYKDTVILFETSQDGYGDDTVSHSEILNGLFLQGTSENHSNNVDYIGTDAHIYLDIENPFVLENAYRLEGMYILCNPFEGREKQSWYKIARVKVGQRKLLENNVNNVHCFLNKCSALDYEES